MTSKRFSPSRAALHASQSRLIAQQQQRARVIAEFERGNLAPLEKLCAELAKSDPQDTFYFNGMGNLALKRGDFNQALEWFQRGLQAAPDDGVMHANLASVYADLHQNVKAYEHALRATELVPGNWVAWLNLSNACNRLQRYGESEKVARRGLELRPGEPNLLNNLANALKEQGRVGEAVELYLAALQNTPEFDGGFINLLLALLYHPEATVADISQVAMAFGARLEARQGGQRLPLHNEARPWRRLRVGFLSPDFRTHSVMYFAEPVIARLDRSQFEVYCYYLRAGEDAVTERLRRLTDHFTILAGLDSLEQAKRISADGIDVLIDLAGHTGYSGLLAMIHRPAPVQITWLGYPGTTGLTTMDWRITDEVADPPGDELFYTEQLLRLPPSFCVYRPRIRQPLERYAPSYQVRPPPALSKGFVTFGCCNNVGKLTPGVLRLWGRLLERVPSAQLLIEVGGLRDREVEHALREKCVTHGIANDRLILVNQESRNQYITYHHIDIALDPFPLCGGTTSFDALWMGCPLVVMQGAHFRERMGMSFLTAIGRQEWIAHDEEEYLAIACRLASDLPALAALRGEMRTRVEMSPLMDEARFATLFGEALRGAWLDWCARQVAGEGDERLPLIERWLAERPTMSPVDTVFLAPGEAITLDEALARLRVLQQAADWPAVRLLATCILESVPQVGEALLALAEVEEQSGERTMALQYLSHALDFLAEPLQPALRFVQWLLEGGQRAQALEVLHWLASRYPAMAGEFAALAESIASPTPSPPG